MCLRCDLQSSQNLSSWIKLHQSSLYSDAKVEDCPLEKLPCRLLMAPAYFFCTWWRRRPSRKHLLVTDREQRIPDLMPVSDVLVLVWWSEIGRDVYTANLRCWYHGREGSSRSMLLKCLDTVALPRQQWSLLNHFRTQQGHCGACRRKWRLTDTDLCPCCETQTMSHIVESCPLRKLNGGLSRLHSADEDDVLWLTSYGWWHTYEKKKCLSRLALGDQHERYYTAEANYWWTQCIAQPLGDRRATCYVIVFIHSSIMEYYVFKSTEYLFASFDHCWKVRGGGVSCRWCGLMVL